MENSAPRAKRMRSRSPTLTTMPVQHHILWFNDGNVILEAESVHFQVHRGVLVLHSPVLEDMLQTVRSPTDSGTDGCPILILHDRANDVENMLFALYHRR